MGVCPEKSTRRIQKGSRTQSKPAMSRANRTHTGQKTPTGGQVYSWQTPTILGIAVFVFMVRRERTRQEALKHVLKCEARKNVVVSLHFPTRTRPSAVKAVFATYHGQAVGALVHLG